MLQKYVGILNQKNRNGLVVLDRPDALVGREILVPARDLNGAPFGMKVVCELDPSIAVPDGQLPKGRIVEVLGDPARPDVAILSIIRQHGLPEHFPDKVLAEADHFGPDPDPADVTAEIERGRRDLRNWRLMTIDGEDAKDLDDAVGVDLLPDGRFRLSVHIADVTHYVTEHSALDLEAAKRGTSVYLVDRVVPMLPPRLSNGTCSLNPERDRLTLSVLLTINEDGEVEDGEILESVIRTKARASYEEVRQALETQTEPEGRYPGFLDDLRLMRRLAIILEKSRMQRGSLEFNFPETHIELDSDGKPLSIEPYPISFANGIIEEFMIAANEFVARHCQSLKLPFLYRVHELPDQDKLLRFVRLANSLGVSTRLRKGPTPAQLAKILEQVKHEPFGLTLGELLLRSLAKARYAAVNLGHFGLASECYCHFTSPIRRYPDLFIHRVIKAQLHGTVKRKRWQTEATALAEHCSNMERVATQAERDTVAQKAAEYLSEHLGAEFEGIISGFNSTGIYIRLANTVEGMVPFRSLTGYIIYDQDRLQAADRSGNLVYNIGDEVVVQVVKVDTIQRRIDFELLSHKNSHVKKTTDKSSHSHTKKTAAKSPRRSVRPQKKRRFK